MLFYHLRYFSGNEGDRKL